MALNWNMHPIIRKNTAIPPSHHVKVTPVVKHDTIRRMEPMI